MNGEGMRRNQRMAYLLFSLCAAQGLPDAREARDLMGEKLSKDELTTAQRAAVEWQLDTAFPAL